MSYLVVFIVIYNACYPNLQKLSYLQIDTRHVEQAWRIYTHVFLHANAIHLTGNCITIFFLTLMLATAHHRQQWRIVILYTLTILQGTFGIGWEKRLVYPDRRFIAVGASGSAYGLLGMNVSALALNWSSMPLRWLRLFVVSFFVAFELVAWYYLYSDRVSVSGHLGGFLGGLMGAPCLLIETSSAVVVAPRNNEIDGDAGTPGTSRNTAAWYCRIVSLSIHHRRSRKLFHVNFLDDSQEYERDHPQAANFRSSIVVSANRCRRRPSACACLITNSATADALLSTSSDMESEANERPVVSTEPTTSPKRTTLPPRTVRCSAI
ncbi:MAG: rhomboid family intramembrane serine protease [Halobacteriaceae archaeon]